MAGEAILVNIVTEILKKLGSFALEEINLARGVKKELEKLQKTILMIEAVIRDAENKQVKEKFVGIWLKDLRDLAYDANDILDEYAYEIMHRSHELNRKRDKVRNFLTLSSNPIVLSSKMGHEIKNLNQKFDELARQRAGLGLQIIHVDSSSHTMSVGGNHGINRENYASVDESKILGREVDKSKIINMLLANKSLCNQNDKIFVIPIVGMGGLGKTTLAKLIYNDEEVKKHFELRMWVCVSDVFDVKKLFIEIIESISGPKFDVVSNLNVIVEELKERLGGKKFLLVLDDVWSEKYDEWSDFKDPLVVGVEGSSIIVTTRSENVASIVLAGEFSSYMLKTLGEDICLSIFEQRAFGPSCRAIKTPTLVEIGKELVRKCGGLPLAAKALGSLMHSKKEVGEWLAIRDSKILDNPENPNNILPILKLSYDHLSPQVKQCFSYCSIFPKDSEIERKTLIQMWMADGFIQPSQGDNRLLEEIGNEYFQILLWNSFFQDVETNEDDEVWSCKMHDLVHDLAQHVAGTHECLIMKASEMKDISELRRLNLLNFNEGSSNEIFSKVLNNSNNKLHTLFIQIGRIKDISNILFDNNKRLRVLDLSGTDIEELPPSIGDLKHLRYLDLSYCHNLTKLPDSITRLYNLQTLNLMYCGYVGKFPKDLNKKLINLRHFGHDSVSGWQHHVGQLICLQNLNKFVVPADNINIRGGCSCVGGIGVGGIGELQCLNLLGGKLEISCLDRVRGRENAEKANLKAKEYIKQLSLEWTRSSTDESSNQSLVLEGLQPHPNLRSLKIRNFMGPKFPTWMSNPSCLPNLVKLQLFGCNRCEQLPSLGELPSLRYLELHSMSRLVEWLEQQPLPLETIIIFECLKLKSMPTLFPSLKEVKFYKVGNGMLVSSIMRSNLDTLTRLDLGYVDGLKFLPQGLLKDNNVLQTLHISDCPDFQGFIQEEEEGDEEDLLLSSSSSISSNLSISCSLQVLLLSNCPVLRLLPGDIIRGLTSLQELSIRSCGELNVDHCESIEMLKKSMPTLFPFMEELKLSSCDGMIVSSVLRTNLMDTLISLLLSNIPGLKNLPLGLLKDNNVLQRLCIQHCPDFQGFIQEEEEGDEEDLLLSSSSSSNNNSSLQTLGIYNCPVLRLLPDLMGFTSLWQVSIQGCNEQLVIALPNGVQNRISPDLILYTFEYKSLEDLF